MRTATRVQRANKFAGKCESCGTEVPAGKGLLTGSRAAGWGVKHRAATWVGSPVSGSWVGGCPKLVDQPRTLAMTPAPWPFDARVSTDHMGRVVAIVPDEVAERLRASIEDGWTEIRGVADGYSRDFARGTWVYNATMRILDEVAKSGTERAERAAADERGYREYYGFIVGESDWSDETRWWVDYPANAGLHVPGFPATKYGSNGSVVVYGG
jgi:hypothetical protein